MRDDRVRIVKLQILETELDSPFMQVCLHLLAQPQAKEAVGLDEVSRAMGEGSGDVVRLCRSHDEAQWDGCFLLMRRILIQEVVERPH